MKSSYIYKQLNKKAFTLIELLIVIAIIGILFIVLVSKVDFATDKAKASGVQTDFRSFQMAFEQVARENAGFNTFGWDTGDDNGDRVRNSYDVGDTGLQTDGTINSALAQNGIKDGAEVWTGRKVYSETWNDVWTLVKPGTTGAYDKDAIVALESAINKNLDPKLHITISTDGTVTMANQARDPWKVEYQGVLLSNSDVTGKNVHNPDASAADKLDRGAIVMYSLGANGKLGSQEKVELGSVIVTISKTDANGTDNNVDGKDDYSLATIYTFKNGYGEVISTTTGFSNNQTSNNGLLNQNTPNIGGHVMLSADNRVTPSFTASFKSDAEFESFESVKVDGFVIASSNYTVVSGSTLVTLNKEYIATLSAGNHTIEIISSTGTANASFEVVNQVAFKVDGVTYYVEREMTFADWFFACGQGSTSNGILWADNDGYLYLDTENHITNPPTVQLCNANDTKTLLKVGDFITNGAEYIGDPKSPT